MGGAIADISPCRRASSSMRGSSIGPPGLPTGRRENTVTISITQHELLRSCQQIVDNCSRIECNKCGLNYTPMPFYEHIKQGPCFVDDFDMDQKPLEDDFTMCLDDEVSVINYDGHKQQQLAKSMNFPLQSTCQRQTVP